MEDTDKNKESTEESCCYCVVDGCGCVVGSYCCDDPDMSNCTFETS